MSGINELEEVSGKYLLTETQQIYVYWDTGLTHKNYMLEIFLMKYYLESNYKLFYIKKSSRL